MPKKKDLWQPLEPDTQNLLLKLLWEDGHSEAAIATFFNTGKGRIVRHRQFTLKLETRTAGRGTIKPEAGMPDGYLGAITGSTKVWALLAALVLGGAKGWFVLRKSAVRTVRFIERRPERDWIWMSLHPVLYIMIPVMIGMGLALRHFWGAEYPALIVAVYVGIAAALVVGCAGFKSQTAK